MNIDQLQLPDKGFTKSERAWLMELIAAIRTVRAIQGKNVTINNTDTAQIIAVTDCQPCS